MAFSPLNQIKRNPPCSQQKEDSVKRSVSAKSNKRLTCQLAPCYLLTSKPPDKSNLLLPSKSMAVFLNVPIT